ncbi:hypothetical protein DL96DRAFT_1701944 [Flagelloscypha sp. PMI_526]|nr:hypothetical protein DL96DRAFT_1701944 [Flagelloscypha sp. PMI_526]
MPAIRRKSSSSRKTNAHRLATKSKYSSTNETSLKNLDRNGTRIPRPPNAFLIYRSEFWQIEKAKSDNGERSHREISKLAGASWKTLSEDDQRPYRLRAAEIKLEHKKQYPGYVYNPNRTGGRASTTRTKQVVRWTIADMSPEPEDSSDNDDFNASYPSRSIDCEASSSPMDDLDSSSSSTPTPSPLNTPIPCTFFQLESPSCTESSRLEGWYPEEEIPCLDLNSASPEPSPKRRPLSTGLKPFSVSDLLFCQPVTPQDEEVTITVPILPSLVTPPPDDFDIDSKEFDEFFDFAGFAA